jgi:uncharacterized membrane protein YqhA
MKTLLEKSNYLVMVALVFTLAALFIFAVGLYELFIEDSSPPQWLMVHNLHDLKQKLSGVIILVLAVTFLEHFVEWKDPLGTLYPGLAVAVVPAGLLTVSNFGEKG